MEWALDRETGRPVPAEQAVQGRMRYGCPCCEEPVFLRRGPTRRPNFAHVRYRAPADCENYHPAVGLSVEATVDVRHLGLYLQAEEGGVRPRWGMALLIPPPPAHLAASGEVRVRGLRGTHSIPVGDIRVPGTYVAVMPQGESYVVEFSPEVDKRYVAHAGASALGLDTRRPTVFHAGAVRGRRLDPGVPLWWDHSYFLVWHDACPQHFPDRAGLLPLRQFGEWCCAEIELPPAEVHAVQGWAERCLDRRIRAAPLVPVVIAPQPLFPPEGTTWVVPDGHELIIGAGEQRGARPPERICIRRDGGRAEGHRLPGSLPLALSLGRPAPGQLEIYFPEAPEVRLTVEVVPWVQSGQPAEATLVYRDVRRVERRVPVFSEPAADALREAFDGRCQVTALELPPRVMAILRHRDTPSSAWCPVPFPAGAGGPSAGQDDLGEQLLRVLRTLIAERHGIALDLGTFGLLLAAPWDRALSGVRESIALPAAVRWRARWLRPLLGSAATTTACREVLWSLLRRVAAGSATGSDVLRLQRLCGQWSDPSPLEPHLRVFAAHLRDALSREV